MTPAQRDAVAGEARSWLGTPYHSHGRIKGVGVDCAMLLLETYARAGIIAAADPGYYPEQFGLHRDEELFRAFVERYATPTETPRPGDCVLFRYGRCYSHGGILIDGTTLIHAAMRERAVCYATLNDPELSRHAPLFFTIED